MAYEQPLMRIGNLPANVDFSNETLYQFSCVDVGAATGSVQGTGVGGAAAVVATAGAAMLGILQNNPSQGDAADIVCHGITKAQYGATVAIDQLLAVAAGTGGQAGAAVLIPATAGLVAVAKALESGVAGQIGTVFLLNAGKQ